MPTTSLTLLLHKLRKDVLRAGDSLMSDGQLLGNFISSRDNTAFEILVRRHGPMVFGVCRRILRLRQDAEDAFQSTFLVLARRAASIRARDKLGNWLYGVAYRTALAARRRAARRRAKERQVDGMPHSFAEQGLGCGELWQVLDEELSRLPEKYRLPVVLCDLQARTRKKVARELSIPEGTLSNRLATARRMLAERLSRRGLGLSAASLAAALSQGAASAGVPASLTVSTVRATSAAAPALLAAEAAALAQIVLRAMFIQRLKGVFAAVVFVAVFGSAVLSAYESLAHAPSAEPRRCAEEDAQKVTDLAEPDGSAIVGTWEAIGSTTSANKGKILPPQDQKVGWVITAENIIRTGADGFIDSVWTYRLNPKANPKTIDIVSPHVGTLLGVYDLDADNLRIRLNWSRGAEAGKRPIELLAKADPRWDFKRVSRTPAHVQPRFPNGPGCLWMVEPREPPRALSTAGIIFIYEKDRDGAAVVTLAGAIRGNRPPEYRPILLDSENNRYVPDLFGGGATSERRDDVALALNRWRMDPQVLTADKIARIGIELLTPEAHRVAARVATERAARAGLEVLPWPEIGRPYRFMLTTIDGNKIRSEDLSGKVIVLDYWATSCAPCLALLPELKRCYEQWHADGLEIVGISLDEDADTVRKECKDRGLPWLQTLAPTGKNRKLWQEAAGIETIPRVLLVGRDGVLRADAAHHLETQIANLLGVKTPPGGKR